LECCFFTKLKGEQKEHYIKQLKEISKINEQGTLASIDPDRKSHSLNNSRSNNEYSNRFSIKIKDLAFQIENTSITDSKNSKLESKQSCENSVGNNQLDSPSPRKKILDAKSAHSKKSKISNYHKYIKNIKHIKDKVIVYPLAASKTPPLNTNKFSLELKLNKKKSSNDIVSPLKNLIMEKDDSTSLNLKHHSSSTKDFSNTHMSKHKTNSSKPKKPMFQLPMFKMDEESQREGGNIKEKKRFSIENIDSLLERINSNLDDMKSHITVFDEQMKIVKETLK